MGQLLLLNKMKFNIVTIEGKKVGDLEVEKSVFGIKPNHAVVRQAILSEMSNMRQGTHASKNRAMVNGGGKKPWKQKGRGVARAGTTRSPIWRGGGVVFGPQPHGYFKKVPKKVRKLAKMSMLSIKAADGNLIIIDELKIKTHKTSEFLSILKNLGLDSNKVTVLNSNYDKNLEYATNNIKNVYLVDAVRASSYDLIDCDKILIDKASVALLTEILT
ncbi:MAG: 50S ribosomal protein L4 [Candidatus Marinimicrobia bacterium]|nr:50S ribosomal protein L4 [Candidatus Neomarinimicrobiota bacterium]|tara:strand:+ start:946 stop:1596 length:651 start_codon:yes stop_codon:yes gene_type:complete